ncbi:hypothetical protein B1L04_23965 [Microcystis aeruginosa KW]|uniref:Uncharacterized protein n=1 Tax=Microcystis aeruginosa KW TaxID=1960155 RepID=A0A1V4BN56_MICAE|nr:hypothetical protein [Microcystis aeruginosa]OPF15540.1 hypothetical protein B1L04_23965 [Microcystis aeruginosa KW]
MSYATYRVIRNETLIEKDIWRFLLIVFDLERTNQLNLLPDKDLVDLCHPIEPYQVTKNRHYIYTRQNTTTIAVCSRMRYSVTSYKPC